jgi:hypothetical protein
MQLVVSISVLLGPHSQPLPRSQIHMQDAKMHLSDCHVRDLTSRGPLT